MMYDDQISQHTEIFPLINSLTILYLEKYQLKKAHYLAVMGIFGIARLQTSICNEMGFQVFRGKNFIG